MRAAVTASLAALLACVAHGAESTDSSWTSFEFEAYNREYVNVRSHAEWEQGGPIAVKVSSPSHRLIIREHSVHLRPHGGGEFDARVRGDEASDTSLPYRMEDGSRLPRRGRDPTSRLPRRGIGPSRAPRGGLEPR